MNERTKDFIFYGIMFAYLVLSIMFIAKEAKATQPFNATVQDHSKTIIKRVPQTWEVCSEVNVPGDKTADTLLGALIGGAIGQNITKDVLTKFKMVQVCMYNIYITISTYLQLYTFLKISKER